MASNALNTDSTPPSHQPDPMNYDYPDLGGSVHAIFDTQLPGAATDSPSQSQHSVMNTHEAAARRAEKAPAKDPPPPSFGLFETAPDSSRDRTQLPFFPATIGSIHRNSPAPEPTTAHQTMMVAICKTTGLMEIFNHKINDLTASNQKINARVNLLSHAIEEVIETLNKNLVAFDRLQKSLDNRNAPKPQRPVIPIPNKPVPEVVIIQPARPPPTRAPPPPAAAPTPTPANTSATPATTRTAPHRAAREGPKNYVDKPLTPDPVLQPPTNPGPSRPTYAQIAEGEFQPVVNKNRNHRNRKPRTPSLPSSPDPQPDRDRQIVVIRQETEPTLNPSLCMTIINNIRSRLQYTTCTGTISLVRSSAKGNLLLYADPKHKAQDLWPYRKSISLGLNDSKIGTFDLQLNLMRLPVYISNVPLSYPNNGAMNSWQPEDWTDSALDRLKKDISSSNAVEAVDRPFTIGTLASLKANRMTTCAFVVNLIRSPASIELIRTGMISIGGRRANCREWFPDAHRSYCDRCLTPGHHQIMCRNRTVCKYCKLSHLSDRHRCNTCQSRGFCPAHDTKSCHNCDSTAHFAGDDKCPNRTLHRSIDPEKQRGYLHDPTTSGRHLTTPHPSRFGPPLPTANRAESISSEDLDNAIDLMTQEEISKVNNAINQAINEDMIPDIDLIPDDDTTSVDHTDSHWRPCQCNPATMNLHPCPNTADSIYDISHDHPFCLCPPYLKERRCQYFNIFIDQTSSPPTHPDPQLTNILNTAASDLSRSLNKNIYVTTSGRILVEGIDPDTPEYNEWSSGLNYRPHGDTCHCKASPSNNIPRTHCPNRLTDDCQCYHLPGPIAGLISITGAETINTYKTTKPPKQSHRVTKPAKNPAPSRAHSA